MDDFKRFYRMTRETFEIVCQQIGHFEEFEVTPGGRPPVPLRKQVMVFLWYVGSLEPLCRIADRFNITEFSVLRIRERLCGVLIKYLMPKYIVWPKDRDKQTVIDKFREKRGFPGVLGAVDSSYIQIRPPPQHPQTYVNRKGYHSLILQAVCREDMRFTDCFVGWPGSCHDSRVLKNSDLWENAARLCGDDHLIGDGGFPLRKWLLTPFRDNGQLDNSQRHYNFCLSSTRQVVERAFSHLKGRFRKLQLVDVQTIPTAVHIIISCCVLHNICILQEEELIDLFVEDHNVYLPPQQCIVEQDAEGIAKRQQISRQLP